MMPARCSTRPRHLSRYHDRGRFGRSSSRRIGGAPRSRPSASWQRDRSCKLSPASACQGRCTVPWHSMRLTGSFGRPFCGTTAARPRNAPNSSGASRTVGRLPATWRCRASPRPSCCGSSATNPMSSPRPGVFCCPRIGFGCVWSARRSRRCRMRPAPSGSTWRAEPGRRRGQTARRAGLEAAIPGPADNYRARVELRAETRGEIEKTPLGRPPARWSGVGVGHARPLQGRGHFAEFEALTTSS